MPNFLSRLLCAAALSLTALASPSFAQVGTTTSWSAVETALGRPGAEQMGVEGDRLLEVVDVEGELYSGHEDLR